MAFADDAEPGSPTHYLKQPWGAYGAAYGSQLFETGILAQARDHIIPVPSPQLGEALAQCFEDERGEIAERYIAAIERGVVSLDELDAFSALSPSEIPPDSKERQLYEELLLSDDPEARPADLSRRQTLLLVLTLAQQLCKAPANSGREGPIFTISGRQNQFSHVRISFQRDGFSEPTN